MHCNNILYSKKGNRYSEQIRFLDRQWRWYFRRQCIGDQFSWHRTKICTNNSLYYSSNASYHSKLLFGKILIGTPGCIGAEVDCPDVSIVWCVGLPTRLINFIQEVGCCGCQHDLGNKFNLFEITFVYLIERIYQIDTNKNTLDIERVSNNNQILMLHEETCQWIMQDNAFEIWVLAFLPWKKSTLRPMYW